MSTIPIGRARRLAKEKIGSALVTYLNDYIAAAAAESSYTVPPPMPGIAGPEAVRLVDPDQPDNTPVNLDIQVTVFEDGPRIIDRENSSGKTFRRAQTRQDYKVIIIFRAALGNGVRDADGVKPDMSEQIRHRADLYLEALCTCLYERVPTPGSPINTFELTDDQGYPIYEEDFPVMGVCATTWRAVQMVSIPNPKCEG